MPKTKPMPPDVRAQMKKIVAVSALAYLSEMTQRNFRNPTTPEARAILLEGLAEALHNLTAKDLTGPATLIAFATELLDKETNR